MWSAILVLHASLVTHLSVCLDVLSGVAGVLPTQLVNCDEQKTTQAMVAGVTGSLGLGGGKGRGRACHYSY